MAQRRNPPEAKNKEIFSEEEDNEEVLREAVSITTALKIKSQLPKQQNLPDIPEVVVDFLRNFLRRSGLSGTLNSFESEWYSSAQKLLTETVTSETPLTGIFFIPDALTHRQLIHSELERVSSETHLLRHKVLAVGESLVRMQRERDFHQLQHRQVAEDKNRLIEDFKQLKKHLESYELALRQMDDKYQATLRRIMLITLEKDRVQKASESSLNQDKPLIKQEICIKRSDSTCTAKSPKTRCPQDSQLLAYSRQVNLNVVQAQSPTWRDPSSFSLSCSIRAHKLPISCISLHPRKLILASASDDCCWRLWELFPGEKVGQMLLTGKGHSDWLSACTFHPDGSKLATTSGDTVVRVWDFSQGGCVSTLSGHSQPTWGCSFQSCGHFLVSCSADRTAKLWDLNSEICCLTLHRHTASVNSVCFLPLSNLLLTCSADKTLALWDARLGVCTTTLHGHLHPCNHASFSLAGDCIASCDSHGAVKMWDIRRPVSPVTSVDAGLLGANQVVFSPSGKRVAVASSDRLVRLVEVDSCAVSSLSGHSDAVESVTFDHSGQTVMSAGSDGLIIVWSEQDKEVTS